PTIADAILDRLVHSSHRIELEGESMRKKHKNNLILYEIFMRKREMKKLSG
ncbi:unnamed protein product, partial [marine sediment metagenome]